MLGIILALALAQCGPQGPIYSCPSTTSEVPFDLFTEQRYNSPGRLPNVVDTAALEALCKVNGAGNAWECLTADGGTFGTLTQGTGTTYQGTFAPQLSAMSDVTTAKAPRVVSTTLDTLFKSDHTIIMGGYATSLTDATFQTWAIINDGAARVFYMRNEGGALSCVWSGAGGTRNAINGAAAAANGWSVISCRQSGTDHYARNNGVDSLVVSGAAITANLTAGASFYMGDQGGSIPIRGPLAFVAFYSAAKTDSQLRLIENTFWGVGLDAGGGVSGYAGLLNDAGTHVDFFAPGAHVVSPDRGVRTMGQASDDIQAKWAADPFDVSSWTNVGTPLIGASGLTTTSPFYRWRPSTTTGCFNLEDNDGAAFEGKVSAELQRDTTGGKAHGWNVRVWAAIGDAGTTRDKMRVAIVSPDGVFLSDAGFEEDCDFTLDGVVRPYDCVGYTTDAGVTSVKGRVLIGNTAATQGSITACKAEDTSHAYPQLSLINNTAFGFGQELLDPAPWPSTATKGKYEVVFTPLNNITSPSWDPGSSGLGSSFIYLFDAFDVIVDHNVVIVGGYSIPGRLLARTTSSGGSTEFLVDAVSFIPWQRYAISMEWRPLGGGRCTVVLRSNSCSGSVASCSATTEIGREANGYCPNQPSQVRLGNRYDNTVPTSVFVDTVRVYQ